MAMNTPCLCGKSTSGLECGLCKTSLCKSCTEFVEPSDFSFFTTLPEEIVHGAYCSDCFISRVQPVIEQYNATLEAAKNINVYEKNQSKETRFLSRKEKAVSVENCPGRQEALLRLAFLTVQKGFNAVIDVKIDGKKIIKGTYQTTVYSGSGVPSTVDERRVIKDRSLWQNPN